MKEDKISVIIPSYNNARFLGEAIKSIINQTYPNLEIIIVEGNSSDSSLEIVNGYAKKDSRIVVIVQDRNYGVSKARNDGILASTGKYVAILDSDDVMLPGRIDELYQEIIKNDNYGLVHSDVFVINETGRIIGKIIGKEQYSKGYIRGEVLRRRGCHIGYPMFRKKFLDKVGYYDESLRGGEDYDLYSRITYEYPVAYVRKPLILYRRHCSNASSKLNLMVSHYKKYLDKTFENDAKLAYSSIKNEAYAHYYIDKINLEFQDDKRSFLINVIPGLLHSLQKDRITVFNMIFPVLRILIYRINTIIRKKIAVYTNTIYTQVGW
ncbi:MAG: glycosyltransferase [Methanomicrobiales archaeon]|nr:glycosyltransferase [Methanomicrobiales archaeon]